MASVEGDARDGPLRYFPVDQENDIIWKSFSVSFGTGHAPINTVQHVYD